MLGYYLILHICCPHGGDFDQKIKRSHAVPPSDKTLIDSLSLDADPSVLDHLPSSTIAIENSNAALYCNATGNPKPNITWTRDGNATVLYHGESFTVRNIRREDAGIYVCTAWNGIGNKTNGSTSVTVHCK